SSIDIHLHDLGYVIGIGEKAGMASYSSQQCSALIVDVTVQKLIPPAIVTSCGDDPLLLHLVQRQISGVTGSQGFIKMVLSEELQGSPVGFLQVFLQKVVRQVAVLILQLVPKLT